MPNVCSIAGRGRGGNMARLTNQVIYSNGRYRILPLVTLLVLVDAGGKRVATFDPHDVESAVYEVDRLAEMDGVLAHCS